MAIIRNNLFLIALVAITSFAFGMDEQQELAVKEEALKEARAALSEVEAHNAQELAILREQVVHYDVNDAAAQAFISHEISCGAESARSAAEKVDRAIKEYDMQKKKSEATRIAREKRQKQREEANATLAKNMQEQHAKYMASYGYIYIDGQQVISKSQALLQREEEENRAYEALRSAPDSQELLQRLQKAKEAVRDQMNEDRYAPLRKRD